MMILESRRINLRPIEEKDNILLHEWRNESNFIELFSNRRNPVSLEKFVLEMKRDSERNRHLQFMIELQIGEKKKSIGTIFAYDLNLTDGYIYISTYVVNEYWGKGYGIEACVLLTYHFFNTLPLHKIYFELFSYNKPSLSSLVGMGLSEEGRFRGHRFFEGQRHDLLRYAIYRDSLKRLRKLVNWFKKERKIS